MFKVFKFFPFLELLSKQRKAGLHFKIDLPYPNFKKEFLLFFLIEEFLRHLNLQKQRIRKDLKDNNRNALHADIHFFLIALNNLDKSLEKLKNMLSHNKSFVDIYKNYRSRIKKAGVFRNYLEHRIERLDGFNRKGERLKDPNMFGNLEEGGIYNFGGERLDFESAFIWVRQLSEDLKSWNKDIYPIPKV